MIVVVEAKARFEIREPDVDVDAGHAAPLTAGSAHAFTNIGDGRLHVLGAFAHAAPPVAYEAESGVLDIGQICGEQRTFRATDTS